MISHSIVSSKVHGILKDFKVPEGVTIFSLCIIALIIRLCCQLEYLDIMSGRRWNKVTAVSNLDMCNKDKCTGVVLVLRVLIPLKFVVICENLLFNPMTSILFCVLHRYGVSNSQAKYFQRQAKPVFQCLYSSLCPEWNTGWENMVLTVLSWYLLQPSSNFDCHYWVNFYFHYKYFFFYSGCFFCFLLLSFIA